MALKRNGFFIPPEIFSNNHLDNTNKILLSEIFHILEHNETCFASNKHFAKLVGIGNSSVSKRISQLEKDGYITTKMNYEGKQIVGRYITYLSKNPNNNSSNANKKKRQSKQSIDKRNARSPEHQEVVPPVQKDSSETTKGVVPEKQEGSSPECTGVVPTPQYPSSENQLNNIANNIKEDNAFKKVFRKEHLLEIALEILKNSYTNYHLYELYVEYLPRFRTAFRNYIKEDQYSIDILKEEVQSCFHNCPSWERELLKYGMDKFINTYPNAFDGNPETMAMQFATFIRILQSEGKEFEDQYIGPEGKK